MVYPRHSTDETKLVPADLMQLKNMKCHGVSSVHQLKIVAVRQMIHKKGSLNQVQGRRMNKGCKAPTDGVENVSGDRSFKNPSW